MGDLFDKLVTTLSRVSVAQIKQKLVLRLVETRKGKSDSVYRLSNYICYFSDKRGHIARNCGKKKDEENGIRDPLVARRVNYG